MVTDLQRLIEKYTNEIEQFEGQLREVKRKHDILMEAARLVDEEALNPHKSFNE